ncbi:hypothetical protein [Streptomyces sp. NBC_01506]|uniref:hypothetical protein n=1 Tax=Streptomyces sp. NBC_01506 TaxID=2903887 RepID=UPI003866485C
MIGRWGRYALIAYPLRVQLPFTVAWAVGLTALFAGVTGAVDRWRPGSGLAVTTITLVVGMLLMRALDDIRDQDYDRAHHPERPLPAGVVRERDLMALAAVGAAFLLLLNAGRGVAALALLVVFGYTAAVIAADRLAGWPDAERPALHLAVNLPIQTLISLYVYAGFLRAEHGHPTVPGLLSVVVATLGGLCLELGRKTTRTPRPGERTYVTALGPSGTSLTALGCAVAAAGLALALLRPWDPGSPGHGAGWLVLAPCALPAAAAARFAAGSPNWPVTLTRSYVPAMYASFLAVCWISKGGPA